VSRVQDLESRLREILEKARDWQRVPVKSSPGIFVVKTPGTKRNPPSLLIELNPVDENNMPTKRRGLYIRTRRGLEEYRKLINDRNHDALVSALEEVNGRREEEEALHEALPQHLNRTYRLRYGSTPRPDLDATVLLKSVETG
jgi:hypothetical protein